ncbi:MAG: PhoH-like protein [Alphaproteobacteria bacterium MarineAlpha6_Bin4]|nr:MAG: PhoH-like protein [Alphaproteobacteria bacterium MarineAlpha6_Bin5]PPR38359.1 MAG: PhoH-like protein [Alphaproteobacteria bacterium MarineAlpha6_Bin4]
MAKNLGKNIIEFDDNSILRTMLGVFHKNLDIIEHELDVTLSPKGNIISINGNSKNIIITKNALSELYERAKVSEIIEKRDVESIIKNMKENNENRDYLKNSIKTPKKEIWPRTKGQSKLLKEILNKEIVFAIGPAGTGKTFLAVSHAVYMLTNGLIEKIIISRPAVEAGEKLGFLPGDLKEKIDPYLRPIYDCLDENLPKDKVLKLIENQKIEIAPIAYLRGRTLNNSYIILDESQNTSPIQMKMFLTRLGENSRMVVTGDLTQIDLPLKSKSGLTDAVNNLKKIKDISFVYLTEKDVVRNPLVQKIVKAYDR